MCAFRHCGRKARLRFTFSSTLTIRGAWSLLRQGTRQYVSTQVPAEWNIGSPNSSERLQQTTWDHSDG
jgi:hypothetical protein